MKVKKAYGIAIVSVAIMLGHVSMVGAVAAPDSIVVKANGDPCAGDDYGWNDGANPSVCYTSNSCVTLTLVETQFTYTGWVTYPPPADQGWVSCTTYSTYDGIYESSGTPATAWRYRKRIQNYSANTTGTCGPTDEDNDTYMSPCQDCDDNNASLHQWNETQTECAVVDADGDGINDDIDPLPEDDSLFTWKKSCFVKSADGVCRGWVYEVENVQGEKTYMTVGMDIEDCESYSSGRCYLSIGGTSEYGDSTNWADQFETENVEAAFNSDYSEVEANALNDPIAGAVGAPSYEEPQDLGDGQGSETGDSDSVLLKKIADNTATGTGNMQGLMDGLVGVQNGIVDGNKLLGGISKKLEAPTGNFGTGTGDADTAQDQIDQLLGETGYQGEDIPEEYRQKKDIEEAYGEIGASEGLQGVKDTIESIGVETSGADCSMEFSYNGQQVEMGFCDWTSEFELIGNLFLSFMGLWTAIYIFGK